MPLGYPFWGAIWALFRIILRYFVFCWSYFGGTGRYWGAGALFGRYRGAIGRYSAKHVGKQGSLQKTHKLVVVIACSRRGAAAAVARGCWC